MEEAMNAIDLYSVAMSVIGFVFFVAFIMVIK